jgi:hypothetical protein
MNNAQAAPATVSPLVLVIGAATIAACVTGRVAGPTTAAASG